MRHDIVQRQPQRKVTSYIRAAAQVACKVACHKGRYLCVPAPLGASSAPYSQASACRPARPHRRSFMRAREGHGTASCHCYSTNESGIYLQKPYNPDMLGSKSRGAPRRR